MPPTPRVTRRDMRQLIQKLLRTDSDQDAFVLDYFHEVFRLFTAGMDRTQKVNLLFEHHEADDILQALRQQHPEAVDKCLAQLGAAAPAPGPTEPPPSSEPPRALGIPHLVCLYPSGSSTDRAACLELRKYLTPKVRAGSLSIWSADDALPGEQLERARERHLQDAAVVVLLVSPDFLADAEMDAVVEQVLRRRAAGRCVVVPVLISAADWKSSRFGSLQPVPRDGVPLRSRKDRDSAWVEVVEGLSQALQHRPQRDEPSAEPSRQPPPSVQTPGPRVAPVFPPPAAPSVSVSADVSELLVPPPLARALERGAVVPFAGAGVSRAVHSRATDQPLFPDWRELLLGAADLLKRSGKEGYARAVSGLVDIGESDSFLEAARRAQQGLGPVWFQYLREVLDPPSSKVKPESLALAQALWTLGSKLVITTNYDQVLRWACPDSLQKDQHTWDISAPAEFAAMLSGGLDRATIWHLHGYVGNLANIILTPDGYQRLYPESSFIKGAYEASLLTLRAVLSSRTLLFVGFSFSDAALREQVRFLDEVFRGAGGPHYLMVEQSRLELARERLRGLPSIELLPFASRELLPAQLRRLAALQRS